MRSPLPPIVLTDDQKREIDASYGKEDILSIARRLFNNPELDGRSREYQAVRAYLASVGVETARRDEPKAPLELSEEQKACVRDLAHRASTCLELTRLVWNNPELKQLSPEYRAVWKYEKEVYPKGLDASDQAVEELEWKPPATIPILVGLVNDCVPSGTQRRTYNYGQLKTSEERQLLALMSYIRTLRFQYQANQYRKQIDRDLFISTFIRHTHDKADLTQVEQDQFVSAAAETVSIARIERDLEDLAENMREMLDGDRDARGKFMGMVELINTTRGKLDQSKERLKKLIEGLEGSRNERLKNRDERSSSILNMFDAVLKSKERRQALATLGEKEHEEDAAKANEIKDVEDLGSLIAGQTLAEARG